MPHKTSDKWLEVELPRSKTPEEGVFSPGGTCVYDLWSISTCHPKSGSPVTHNNIRNIIISILQKRRMRHREMK